MKAFLAVCMSCGLEGPPELLERGPDGWLICPACGSSDVAEYVESGFGEDQDDGSVPL